VYKCTGHNVILTCIYSKDKAFLQETDRHNPSVGGGGDDPGQSLSLAPGGGRRQDVRTD
jgi:hypothetical protein